MKPGHKETVTRQVLPKLSQIQDIIGEISPVLMKILIEGQGADMAKMTFATNDLKEATAKIQATACYLNEILEKKEEPR